MASTAPQQEVKLRRVLSLTDLVIYGIILIQPVAALPLFGHANNISKGHAVTTLLFAMIAMIFTAVSYGRMANRYPQAGSAYNYVGRGLNMHLGFIAGWTMFMDYMIVPILCTIYTSITANHLLPFIPLPVWFIFFAGGFTVLNLNGIKATSRANWILMIVLSAVVFWFMAAAVRYVMMQNGIGGIFSMDPFYHPSTFDWSAIGAGTALAALTYIGFDGLTTLSEEVKNPRRNVLLATVLTCLITGIWSGSQVYLAQISWPDWTSFTAGLADEAARNSALDTAILAVAARIGGHWLDAVLAFMLMVASIGSGVTAQAGASRVMFGMGRDKVLPEKFFGHLDAKHAGPSYNIILIGFIALIGAFTFNYETCARLINFGAFLAFMLVNASAIKEYYFSSKNKNFLKDFLPPFLGIAASFCIWISLPLKTWIVGGSWSILGIIYLAIRTNGFKKVIVMKEFSDS